VSGRTAPHAPVEDGAITAEMAETVLRMLSSFDPAIAAAYRTHDGVDYWFCGTGCADAFDADPARFTTTPLAQG